MTWVCVDNGDWREHLQGTFGNVGGGNYGGGNNDVVERRGLWAHLVRLTGLFKIQLASPASFFRVI